MYHFILGNYQQFKNVRRNSIVFNEGLLFYHDSKKQFIIKILKFCFHRLTIFNIVFSFILCVDILILVNVYCNEHRNSINFD